MTIKKFDSGRIIIDYNEERVSIIDNYNDFRFCLDVRMKRYFVPCVERLYKICDMHKELHIPTHKYVHNEIAYEVLCNGITNCYRKYGVFEGNYMDRKRKDKIISAFKQCFKRVKEEDIELSDVDFEKFPLRFLLLAKKGLL